MKQPNLGKVALIVGNMGRGEVRKVKLITEDNSSSIWNFHIQMQGCEVGLSEAKFGKFGLF